MPRGSGLSSSAALAVSLCLALIALAGAEPPERLELARLCQRIEHDWVGAQTGLLDQIASLFGRAEHAVLIDFRSLELRPLPLALGEHRLVTLYSGERHANAGSGYNRRREECAEACAALGIASLRDALLEDLHRLPDPSVAAPATSSARTRRVLAAVTALRPAISTRSERCSIASHASLRDDYEVSTAGGRARGREAARRRRDRCPGRRRRLRRARARVAAAGRDRAIGRDRGRSGTRRPAGRLRGCLSALRKVAQRRIERPVARTQLAVALNPVADRLDPLGPRHRYRDRSRDVGPDPGADTPEQRGAERSAGVDL